MQVESGQKVQDWREVIVQFDPEQNPDRHVRSINLCARASDPVVRNSPPARKSVYTSPAGRKLTVLILMLDMRVVTIWRKRI